ncbi:MAG: PDDEXK nuclease domain-containing protein [Verrucomicrobiota bacterium]|jgi:predicted nuclease of restriction endonuclease-like (RecB) superfamily
MPPKQITFTKALPVLHGELRELILAARQQVAHAVNVGLTLAYWQVGERIRREVLREKRAAYGKEILPTLSAKLVPEFGAGFGARNLARMVGFTEAFPDFTVVTALAAQLGWSHFVEILALKDPLAREFYAELSRVERWSVRTLREKINSQLYLRTALSKKPEALARKELAALREENRLTPDLVFRDPYVLNFLQLPDSYAERDLEAAILHDIEAFLLELGEGFTFVARQKRMTVDGVDHYLDLLFYHRRLHRLFAVELKLGAFRPADKGQMELYLAWLRENERVEGEQNPVGLILCADRNDETVRLLGLNEGPVRVASYLADMLPKKELERRLHDAVHRARARLTKALPGSGTP